MTVDSQFIYQLSTVSRPRYKNSFLEIPFPYLTKWRKLYARHCKRVSTNIYMKKKTEVRSMWVNHTGEFHSYISVWGYHYIGRNWSSCILSRLVTCLMERVTSLKFNASSRGKLIRQANKWCGRPQEWTKDEWNESGRGQIFVINCKNWTVIYPQIRRSYVRIITYLCWLWNTGVFDHLSNTATFIFNYRTGIASRF